MFIVSNWILAASDGENCNTACGLLSKTCDATEMDKIRSQALITSTAASIGYTCTTFYGGPSQNRGIPWVRINPDKSNAECWYVSARSAACDESSSGYPSLCYCGMPLIMIFHRF